MAVFDEVERDVRTIQLPRWGRVVDVDDAVPWVVVDENGEVMEPLQRLLLDCVARRAIP